jgi:hypothetical protein
MDAYEIQVYDGTANAPGVPGIELHANRVARGVQTSEAPELPQHRQSHLTLEPSLGILPFWEIGGYLQSAIRADGQLDYAGAKLRSKFVSPPGWDRFWRLGVNVELSLMPDAYDRDRWGTEVRPIVAWEDERWMFAFNPIVSTPLGGTDFRYGPALEPALSLERKFEGAVGVGIEYYASLGPMSNIAGWSSQQHVLYEVINVLSIERLEVNAGIGEGLTKASNPLTFKLILGWSFER